MTHMQRCATTFTSYISTPIWSSAMDALGAIHNRMFRLHGKSSPPSGWDLLLRGNASFASALITNKKEGPHEPYEMWEARMLHQEFLEWLATKGWTYEQDLETAWLAGYNKRADEGC